VHYSQLSFKDMFYEVDKELQERASRLKVEHIEDCDGSCIASKKNKSYKEVQLVTEAISFLVDYFKKYSPDSVWGKWLQDYYHVKVIV